MAYRVTSDRWVFPRGSLVSESMLPSGCNISVLLEAGHLVRVQPTEPVKKKPTKPPVLPEPEPADRLEEHN